jgi:GNAT superfamily N-acetyltransferase
LPEHVGRSGFVFVVAREAGEIVGFAYGDQGAYGHWWTDNVAQSLSAGQREQWLDAPHFEIVELHVRPSWQRRGVGSALLAQLLSRQPFDRALLSTQTGSRKARDFYAKNGWSELASVDFGAGYPPYLVLGKMLRSYLPATPDT